MAKYAKITLRIMEEYIMKKILISIHVFGVILALLLGWIFNNMIGGCIAAVFMFIITIVVCLTLRKSKSQ